jgi:hypothetical protein
MLTKLLSSFGRFGVWTASGNTAYIENLGENPQVYPDVSIADPAQWSGRIQNDRGTHEIFSPRDKKSCLAHHRQSVRSDVHAPPDVHMYGRVYIRTIAASTVYIRFIQGKTRAYSPFWIVTVST